MSEEFDEYVAHTNAARSAADQEPMSDDEARAGFERHALTAAMHAEVVTERAQDALDGLHEAREQMSDRQKAERAGVAEAIGAAQKALTDAKRESARWHELAGLGGTKAQAGIATADGGAE